MQQKNTNIPVQAPPKQKSSGTFFEQLIPATVRAITITLVGILIFVGTCFPIGMYTFMRASEWICILSGIFAAGIFYVVLFHKAIVKKYKWNVVVCSLIVSALIVVLSFFLFELSLG